MYQPKTWDEAVLMYRAGQYKFRAPPVCTARWSEVDWIHFVFGHNLEGDPTK